MFRSLRVANFRLFFIGQMISQVGTWMQTVAVIWVVLEITDDGVSLGLVTAAQFLPVLCFGIWAGAVADRVDHHRFMLYAQTAFTVIAVAFVVLVITDALTMPFVYALSLMVGFATALDNPVRRALIGELVEPDDVPNAVALNSTLMTTSRVIGPMVAGLLITSVGVEWCFVVNAVTYVAVIAALFRMDRSLIRPSPRVVRSSGQVREGLRYVWSEPPLRLPLALLAVIGTFAFAFPVTLPLLAERTLDGDANTFTLLFAVMSAGSVVGALALARQRDVSTSLLAWSAVGLGLSMVVLALAPSVEVALAATVPVGIANVLLISGANSVVQLRAAPAMRGRVLALATVVFLGTAPIGGPIVGWVSEQFGARSGIWLGAVTSMLAGAFVLLALRRIADPEVLADRG